MMLRDILLHMDHTERCAERLDLAARLAARDGGHLTGMFLIDVPRQHVPHGDEVGGQMGGPYGLMAQQRARAIEDAAPVQAQFEAAAQAHGITAEWRLEQGDAPDTLAAAARYADLVIIGQPDPGAPDLTLGHAVTATALLASGRPVLSVPYAGHFAPPERHALVGWNGSREAARAVNDALPLLARCARVTVLAINQPRAAGARTEEDICAHLRRHAIAAQPIRAVANDVQEGQALLSYAADIDADLIVMGAWGRSRLREWAFGGVTRTVLGTMTAPVLMSG